MDQVPDDPGIPEDQNRPNGQRAGFAVPRWARPAGDPEARSGWRIRLRRKLVWPVAALLLLVAVWSNYPFIPNPWVLLFRQPDGEVSAVSSPVRWAMQGAGPQGANFIPGAPAPLGIIERVIEVDAAVRSAPAVADGVIYIGGQSRVMAFDAGDGRQIWERAISGPAHGVPALAGSSLYLGTLNKRVIALDTGSGRMLWEYEGDSPFLGSVTVQGGIVYAGSRGGHVHALDAESGRLLWKVGLGSPAVAPIVVHNDKMMVASTGGVLFVRDSGTGDKRSRIRTGAALVASPVAADGLVFLLSEGDLLAFDATLRELPGRYPAELIWAQLWVWHFPLPAPSEHSGLQWRVSPGEDMGAFIHPPAVTEEALYLGTAGGEVVALAPADGSLMWRMQSGAPAAASPPLVAGDTLIVALEDGSIRAIDRFRREEVMGDFAGVPGGSAVELCSRQAVRSHARRQAAYYSLGTMR